MLCSLSENDYFDGLQLISSAPMVRRSLFVVLKGLEPMKAGTAVFPFPAPSGLGWLLQMQALFGWLDTCRSAVKALACPPQRMNTMGCGRFTQARKTAREKSCQPQSLWLLGFPCSTVNTVFRRRTPCFAQGLKSPDSGIGRPKSAFSSLKMFFKDGGGVMPGPTLNARPFAWPGP